MGALLKKIEFAPPFDPLTLFADGEQGALLDLVPSTYLYQDLSGTVPVVADGDLAALAQDLSPNGNDFTQGTTARRLEWTANAGGIMGLSALDDGDLMVATLPSAISSFTLVVRATAMPLDGAFAGLFGVWDGTNNNRIIVAKADTDTLRCSVISGGVSTNSGDTLGSLPVDEVFTVVFTYDATTGDMFARVNDGTPFTATAPLGGSFGSTALLCSIPLEGIGDKLEYSKPVHRVVLIDRVLNAQEVAGAKSWVEALG